MSELLKKVNLEEDRVEGFFKVIVDVSDDESCSRELLLGDFDKIEVLSVFFLDDRGLLPESDTGVALDLLDGVTDPGEEPRSTSRSVS